MKIPQHYKTCYYKTHLVIDLDICHYRRVIVAFICFIVFLCSLYIQQTHASHAHISHNTHTHPYVHAHIPTHPHTYTPTYPHMFIMILSEQCRFECLFSLLEETFEVEEEHDYI